MAALASNSSFVAPAAPQATPNDQVYLKISAPPGPCTCGESTCSLKMGHSLGQPSSRRQDTQRVSRIRAIYEARPAPALRIAPRHVSSSSSGSSKGKSSANTSEREWDKVWGDFCCTPAATPSSASVRSRQSGETLQTKSDPPSAQVKQIASFGLGTLHLRPTSGERRASMPLSANSSQGEHPHDAPLLRRASSFSPADYPTYRSKGSEPMLRDGSSSSGTPALSPSLSLSLSLPSPLTPAMSRGWTDDLDIHPAHLPPVRSSGYAMPPYPSNAEERSEGGPAPFVPGLLRAGAKPKLPDPFARYRPSSPATATAPLSRDLPMRSPYGMLLPPPISPRYSPRYSPRSPLWHGTDLPLPSISAVLAHDPSADEPLDPALERKSPDSALTPVSLTQSPIINLIEPLPIENCGAQNLACRRRQRALSLAEMRPIPLKHNDEDDAAMNVDGATAMRPSHSATDAPSSGTRPQIVVEACNPADLMLIDRIAPRKSDSTSQLRSTAPKTGDASLPLELPRLNTERTEVAVERPLLRLPLPPLTISVPSSRASSSGTTSATSPSSFAPSPVSPTPPVVPQTSIPPPPKAPSPTNIAPSSSPSPTIPSPSSSSPSVLFPRHGQVPKRTNTRPPAHEFNRPPEQAHLEPRAQAPKFDGDLYTPLWVRLGKGGSGASAAKAQAGSKEGWCGLCERDGDGRGGWLHLRNSSYRYHMIRVHGISPKTCKAFVEPIETRHSAPDPATGEPRDGAELEGLCHECSQWICFSKIDPVHWSVHASSCHTSEPTSSARASWRTISQKSHQQHQSQHQPQPQSQSQSQSQQQQQHQHQQQHKHQPHTGGTSSSEALHASPTVTSSSSFSPHPNAPSAPGSTSAIASLTSTLPAPPSHPLRPFSANCFSDSPFERKLPPPASTHAKVGSSKSPRSKAKAKASRSAASGAGGAGGAAVPAEPSSFAHACELDDSRPNKKSRVA